MSNGAPQMHAIVFADVAGSTRLYETAGDVVAKRLITELQNEIVRVVVQAGGHVVEIVGDEVLCRFDDVSQSVAAVCRIQEQVEAYSLAKDVDMSVRIGMHHGPAIIENGKIFGDSVNVAARMAAIAQGRQIITTGQVVDNLSPDLRDLVRRFDEVKVKGKQEPIVIYDVLWRDDSVTYLQAAAVPVENTGHPLCLYYGGNAHLVRPTQLGFTIGRNPGNGLIVNCDSVSRTHARVEYSRGKFMLIDISTNGTYVVTHDSHTVYLRREALPLLGCGHIGLGRPVSEGDEHVVLYECR